MKDLFKIKRGIQSNAEYRMESFVNARTEITLGSLLTIKRDNIIVAGGKSSRPVRPIFTLNNNAKTGKTPASTKDGAQAPQTGAQETTRSSAGQPQASAGLATPASHGSAQLASQGSSP